VTASTAAVDSRARLVGTLRKIDFPADGASDAAFSGNDVITFKGCGLSTIASTPQIYPLAHFTALHHDLCQCQNFDAGIIGYYWSCDE
jgi:hypothetical protein